MLYLGKQPVMEPSKYGSYKIFSKLQRVTKIYTIYINNK